MQDEAGAKRLSLAASLLVLLAAGLLLASLEWVVSKLAPAETEDPRLGALAFWVWVAATGSLTYVGLPYVGRINPRLEALLWACGALGWLAWKLGLGDGWEDSPRDREEIWATTVGIGIAFFFDMFTRRA